MGVLITHDSIALRGRIAPPCSAFLADQFRAPFRSQGGARANWPEYAAAALSGSPSHRRPSAASLFADQPKTSGGKRHKAALVSCVIVA
jgi:hypothetical protein